MSVETPPPPRTGVRTWLVVVLVPFVAMAGYVLGCVRARLEFVGGIIREQARIEEQRARLEEREKALQERIEDLQERVAGLEVEVQAREAELREARDEVEDLQQRLEQAMATEIASVEQSIREDAKRDEEVRRRAAVLVAQWRASRAAGGGKAPKEGEPEDPESTPDPLGVAAPPPRSLGPTAVTDPAHVRKVLDSLNALLARAGAGEVYRVTSAEAVDGDRLVRVRIEVRSRGGDPSRTFQAGEARFVLVTASRSLEIRLRDGEATYPGERRVPFVDGLYTALLDVDPDPLRASGHPLIAVR